LFLFVLVDILLSVLWCHWFGVGKGLQPFEMWTTVLLPFDRFRFMWVVWWFLRGFRITKWTLLEPSIQLMLWYTHLMMCCKKTKYSQCLSCTRCLCRSPVYSANSLQVTSSLI